MQRPDQGILTCGSASCLEVERGQGQGHPDPDQKHPEPGRGLPAGS